MSMAVKKEDYICEEPLIENIYKLKRHNSRLKMRNKTRQIHRYARYIQIIFLSAFAVMQVIF